MNINGIQPTEGSSLRPQNINSGKTHIWSQKLKVHALSTSWDEKHQNNGFWNNPVLLDSGRKSGEYCSSVRASRLARGWKQPHSLYTFGTFALDVLSAYNILYL